MPPSGAWSVVVPARVEGLYVFSHAQWSMKERYNHVMETTMPKIAEIPWEAVEDSSNIQGLYWHEPTHTVCVRFNSGGLYSYLEVPEPVYMDLRNAPSVGQYLHRVVKSYPYTRWDTEHELISHLNV